VWVKRAVELLERIHAAVAKNEYPLNSWRSRLR